MLLFLYYRYSYFQEGGCKYWTREINRTTFKSKGEDDTVSVLKIIPFIAITGFLLYINIIHQNVLFSLNSTGSWYWCWMPVKTSYFLNASNLLLLSVGTDSHRWSIVRPTLSLAHLHSSCCDLLPGGHKGRTHHLKAGHRPTFCMHGHSLEQLYDSQQPSWSPGWHLSVPGPWRETPSARWSPPLGISSQIWAFSLQSSSVRSNNLIYSFTYSPPSLVL